MARTRSERPVPGDEELRRWREGLEEALLVRRKRKRRSLRWIAIGLLVLVVVGVGAGYAYWRIIGGLFTRTDVALEPAGGSALNVLLVGSDSREGVQTPEDIERFGEVGGRRADTIILAQLVPTEQRGVLLHFPRDLYVTIHGSGREYSSKINAAYNDGPQSLIDTVGRLTGLPINHYMEIDINGFRSMVDAIGGIDICIDEPLYDSQLNFRLPEGTTELDGEQALSFVRARYATPDGDFGRIRRQQQFIRAVMGKVGQPSVLGNPVRVNELARSFASNVTVDQFFQLDDLVKFALSVRRVGPDQLATYSVPGDIANRDGQSVVLMDQPQAEAIFGALRAADDPAEVLQTSRFVRRAPAAGPGEQAQSTGPCGDPV